MTSLEIISGPLSAQIVCFKAKFTDGKSQLLDCLRTLVENATWDDALLKSISLKVLTLKNVLKELNSVSAQCFSEKTTVLILNT